MYKKKVSYLLHSLTSFVLMLISQRLLAIFASDLFETEYLNTMFIFLVSSVVAVVSFKFMPNDITPDDTEEIPDPVPPMIKRDTVTSILCTVIAFCSIILLMHIVGAFLGSDGRSPYTFSPMYFISLVIIHPIVEEFVFRRLYHSELRLLTPLFAVVAQATMFALNHSTVQSMFTALFSGIVLGLLIENTGRWYLCVITHSCVNLRTLIYTTAFADNSAVTQYADFIFYSIGILSLVLLVIYLSQSKAVKAEDKTE